MTISASHARGYGRIPGLPKRAPYGMARRRVKGNRSRPSATNGCQLFNVKERLFHHRGCFTATMHEG